MLTKVANDILEKYAGSFWDALTFRQYKKDIARHRRWEKVRNNPLMELLQQKKPKLNDWLSKKSMNAYGDACANSIKGLGAWGLLGGGALAAGHLGRKVLSAKKEAQNYTQPSMPYAGSSLRSQAALPNFDGALANRPIYPQFATFPG